MPSVSRILLSGSTDGKQLGATDAGTTIHVATSDADTLDELHLCAQNPTSADIELTLEIGGSSAPDFRTISVRAKEAALWVVRGDLVLANGTAVIAKVPSSGENNGVVLSGFCNRIVQSA